MTLFRSALTAALLSVALAGCGGATVVDGGTGGSGGAGGGAVGGCTENSQCGDPTLYFCDDSTNTCKPACRVKADCTEAVRGAANKIDFCGGAIPCECDQLACVAGRCSADADCGAGNACRNGGCVPAPAASTVAKCTVIPDYQVLKVGQKAPFTVSTWNAANEPVIIQSGVEWTADNAAVTVTSAGLAAEATGVSETAAGAVSGVKATIGTVTCAARVLVVSPTVAAGSLTAVVTDELSHRPIAGARIVVSNPDTGASLITGETTASGVATVVVPGTPTRVTVTAFHADYSYLTIAGYDFTGSRLLSFVVRRNQVDKYGGYKGTFTNPPASANVRAGLAGMSLAGGITDLNISQLLGPTKPTRIQVSSIDTTVPLPAGVYLALGDSKFKEEIAGQGLAGSCADDAKSAAGTCGVRSAWGLAADVPLTALPLDALAGGTIDFGKVLAKIIPVFSKFNSSVVRDVAFDLKTTPKRNDGTYNFDDTAHYVAQNLEFSQQPLSFGFAARVPDLPRFKGSFVDGVIILGGAIVPGRGVVPLGIGAAVNTAMPINEKTDKQNDLPAEGLVTVRMAPNHHGTEGSPYGLISLGVSVKSLAASEGLAASAIFSRIDALKFDLAGTSPVALGDPFPAFPENAKFNFLSAQRPGFTQGRQFVFTADPKVGDTSIVRVSFADDSQHYWTVYADSAAAATSATGLFTLPAAPTGFDDRTYAGGTAGTGARSAITVQTVKLNSKGGAAGGAKVDFKGFVEQNDTNGDRLTDFLTSFSVYQYAPPSITFTTPENAGATIAKGSVVTVTVAAFKVGTAAGDDGIVRLSFTGGTGCAGLTADGTAEKTAGKGDVEIVLPAACTGAVTLRAQLFDNATPTRAPIEPTVVRTLAVTISP